MYRSEVRDTRPDGDAGEGLLAPAVRPHGVRGQSWGSESGHLFVHSSPGHEGSGTGDP